MLEVGREKGRVEERKERREEGWLKLRREEMKIEREKG